MIKKTLYFGNPAYLSLKDNQRVKSFVPEQGSVGILTITDKQFGDIAIFEGRKTVKPETPGLQLELF